MPSASYRSITPQTPLFANFAARNDARPWIDAPRWPCSWVRLKAEIRSPFVIAYRLKFHLDEARIFPVHISGDERYEFFVNGERVGRGPSRSPRGRWHYESYELNLPAGEHVFSARVHSLGKLSPWAQTSYGHGWLLAPEPDDLWNQLGTGRADWEAKVLTGYKFESADELLQTALGCGPVTEVQGDEYDWYWSQSDEGWSPVATSHAGNNGFTLYFKDNVPLLHPSPIPPMQAAPYFDGRLRDALIQDSETPFPLQFGEQVSVEEEKRWSGLFKGESVLINPHQKVRVLWDFEDYVAAYPTLTTSGGKGAVIRLGWSEALVDGDKKKGNRSHIEGRYWRGMSDSFSPDGGELRQFEPLWWRCGRYLLLEIETSDRPLQLEHFALEKTGYPLLVVAQWGCSEPSWETLFELCQRSLQACMHETYMDCPFYEQLQYIGDTRLQMLLTYALSNDDRLARQALTAFASAERNPSGRMPSNHPSQVGQNIPPFTLWWVSMLRDFGQWRGDKDFVKSLLPTARQVLETWLGNLQNDGLAATPEGWNFIDWVDHLGDAQDKFHGVLNWHVVYTLRQMAELEEWCGELEISARMHRLAKSIAGACERFWQPERQLYADNLEQTLFSEHANCLAILSGLTSPERSSEIADALFEGEEISSCTIYFSHYLFEAAAASKRPDVIENRLAPWLALASQGYVTTPETFAGARSDCHAWGAHPLYHYFASILGIRPASWGFESVEITPQLGSLPWANAKIPHPRGEIQVEVRRKDDEMNAVIVLPEGVGGVFRCGDAQFELNGGKQEIKA